MIQIVSAKQPQPYSMSCFLHLLYSFLFIVIVAIHANNLRINDIQSKLSLGKFLSKNIPNQNSIACTTGYIYLVISSKAFISKQ